MNVVAEAFEGRTRIEDVDIAFVSETLLLEHRARGARVIVHFSDDRASGVWQQIHVNRMPRHQLGNE